MSSPLPTADTAPGRVLVVDDQQVIRRSLDRLLSAEGHEVVAVPDGSLALDAIGRFDPDVVLLDLMMPGMDGIEVCRRVREDATLRFTPILMLTGAWDSRSRVEALDAGADDFLSKPPERSELMARIRSLMRLRRRTAQLVRAESVVLSLARSIEGKDRTTQGHCERISRWGVALGKRLGLPHHQLEALRTGGVLHDIGKVGIPDAVLLKEGGLSPDEWQLMRKHPTIGEYICTPIRSFGPVLPIIRHHHERLDGSGYPDGLSGSQIPITARVLQVVDVYDALVSNRPYKHAQPSEKALGVLGAEVRRGWWDPKVFDEFERMIRSSPEQQEGGEDGALCRAS